MIGNVLVQVRVLYIPMVVLCFVLLPAYSLSIFPQNQIACTRLPCYRLNRFTTALLQEMSDHDNVDKQANFAITNITEPVINSSKRECNTDANESIMSQDLTDRFKYKVNVTLLNDLVSILIDPRVRLKFTLLKNFHKF
jgi:hypothetical protein